MEQYTIISGLVAFGGFLMAFCGFLGYMMFNPLKSQAEADAHNEFMTFFILGILIGMAGVVGMVLSQ